MNDETCLHLRKLASNYLVNITMKRQPIDIMRKETMNRLYALKKESKENLSDLESRFNSEMFIMVDMLKMTESLTNLNKSDLYLKSI